jgi:hypothetical protein
LLGTGIAWDLWEAHSQVPEGGDAAERVGHAAGEAVVGEVQRLQPRQRAQLRRQPAGDVVVLQQPGEKNKKRDVRAAAPSPSAADSVMVPV